MQRHVSLGILIFFAGLVSIHAETLVYFGTYTKGEGKGIYLSTLDEKGKLTEPELAGEVTNPSFVAIHPSGEYLYSVSEIANFEGKREGGVSAFKIGEDGKLTLLNQQPSGGSGPCYVALDGEGKCLMVANYGGGSVSSYPVKDDGSIGEASSFFQHEGSSVNPRRQEGPHAHSINPNPGNTHAYAADLGLDKILIYSLDPSSGAMEVNKAMPFLATPSGGGPRHFAFHPSGKFAYSNLEMTLEVIAMKHDQGTGGLELIQKLSTVPEGTPQEGNSTAETQVHPNGKFVYVSNRGPNSIAVFQVDEKSGELTEVERESTRGEIPRNFGIDPSGRFLIAANQRSNDAFVFRIDPETGELEPIGDGVQVPSPVCVRYLKR